MKTLFQIIILSMLCILACGKNYSGKKQPLVENGILDLRNWDFQHDGPVNLNGEWKFSWEKLVTPEKIKMEKWTLIKVPTAWNNQIVNNRNLPDHGYATYYLKVFITPTNHTLALKNITIGSAFNCYVNGQKISSAGQVGKTHKTTIPAYNSAVVNLDNINNEIDILFHISNYNQKYSGIWHSLKIGTSKSLSKLRENNLYLVFFIMGLCLVMFLYYIGLFSLRPKEKITVYFALFCFFMGIRSTSLEELALLKMFPGISFEYIIKIHYLTFYLSVSMSLKFLQKSFPLDYNRTFINILSSFYYTLSVLVILTPATIYTETLLPAQFLFLVSMIYALIISIITIIRKREGAIPIMIGFIAVFMASINDVLITWQLINSMNLVSYAFLVMLFFQSYMITLRFSNTFKKVETLSIKLDTNNNLLNDLNINLEKKVMKRTEELEDERNKLQKRNEEVEKELTLTKVIQQEFIPSKPPIDCISSFYKTMEKVGGDFFDFIRFRDSDEIGIFLSDVSGHGIPAAFITSMIKTIILQAGQRRENPSELLKYLNEILYNNTAGNFITAFYGIYNLSNRTIRYANAGHCHPFVINNDVTPLTGNRHIALAAFPNEVLKNRNSEYRNNKEILPKGSKLILYTDGLTEARPRGGYDFFEHSNMFEVFLKNKDLPSKLFIENLYKELVDFRKEENFDDDICLICLDVK